MTLRSLHHPRYTWILAAIALAACPVESQAEKSHTIPVLVLAENRDTENQFALTPGRPLRCLVVDGGGSILGDPMAGDGKQDPARVAQALNEALDGNYAFSRDADRELDIVYHWGLLRPMRSELPPATQLDPNLRARLLLVDRPERVAEIEKAMVHKHASGAELSSIIQSEMWASTFARAENARYYLIVSAYDHAAQARGQARLVWCTRLSAPERSGPMNDVLVTLARSSRTFLGSDRRSPRTFRIPLECTPTPGTTPSESSRPPFVQPTAADRPSEPSRVEAVIQQERAAFAGK